MLFRSGVLSDEVAQYDLLEEGEYLDLLEKLPKDIGALAPLNAAAGKAMVASP